MNTQQRQKTIPHVHLRPTVKANTPHPPAWLRIACAFVVAALAFALLSPGKPWPQTAGAALLGSLSHNLAAAMEVLWERILEKSGSHKWPKRRLWASILSGVVLAAFIAVGVGKQIMHT